MNNNKLVSWGKIEELGKALHSEGKRIVFTNGCFDILHAGHVLYLQSAKALGDILIVGLNSDESVSRLKGKSRPIVNQEERAMVLSGLESVDYICAFSEDTPLRLIEKLKPNVLVKGGDWQIQQIVGADFVLSYGGEVLSLEFVKGISSSKIIERIVLRGSRD
ncbi:MAG: D-glycero-beta-D-manno-heptose 1-phosphate adenylyltransferase [Candidatus Cloacimonetes bacterium]|nr:D-glycero-beta-D-manno-heptose 1-phosphate adenylyltransferase [Candidatus Cloacimonadota bacterium]